MGKIFGLTITVALLILKGMLLSVPELWIAGTLETFLAVMFLIEYDENLRAKS